MEHWLTVLALWGLKKRPPLVRTRHVCVPVSQHIFNKWLYYSQTNAVISVSKKTQASLGKLINHFPVEKRPVIYAAIDCKVFKPDAGGAAFRQVVDIDKNGILVGLVARFQRIKGQTEFIEAAREILQKRIQSKNILFLLTGRNARKRKAKYENMAQELGVEKNVVFIDEVDDIQNLIASLDIGVVASLGSEGSSRIVMEYMASGIPVIATRVGGIPELVDDGKTGIIVEPGNSSALAQAIIRLIDNDKERKSLAEKGLKRAQEFYNPDRFVQETESLYYSLLE
jgi:glycosyltransferase involved in cell wall biosynthesis